MRGHGKERGGGVTAAFFGETEGGSGGAKKGGRCSRRIDPDERSW